MLYAGAFLAAAVFLFSSRMHERYLFPVLVLILLNYLYARDRRLLVLYIGFSITHFINVAQVLIASTGGVYHLARFDLVLLSVSAVNLMLFCLMVGHGIRFWILPGLRGYCAREARPETVGAGGADVR